MQALCGPLAVRAQLWVDGMTGTACEEATFAVHELGTRRYLSVRDLARALTGEEPPAEKVLRWFTMQEDEIDDLSTIKYTASFVLACVSRVGLRHTTCTCIHVSVCVHVYSVLHVGVETAARLSCA